MGTAPEPTPLSIAISFLTDFIISAGGCLTTAMVATGNTAVPSVAVMIFSIVTGLVAAARRVQALLEQTGTASTKIGETDPGGAKRELTMTAAPGGVVPRPVAIPRRTSVDESIDAPPPTPGPPPPPPGRYVLQDGQWVWITTEESTAPKGDKA